MPFRHLLATSACCLTGTLAGLGHAQPQPATPAPAPESAPAPAPAPKPAPVPAPAPAPAPEPAPAPAPAPAPKPAPAPESAPQDLSEIQAALAADASQAPAAPSTSATSPVPLATVGAGQSLNPDISLIADFAAAAFSSDERLEGGAHDPSHNGFNLQGVELSFSGAVDPYLRFDSHIAFDLEEVDVEEAYGTTLGLPLRLQARLGKFLNRFGRINASHPHTWNFSDQPFALTRVFGAEGNQGLGVELSWLTPLPWYVELVGAATMAEGGETNRSFWGDEAPELEGAADLAYLAAIKQFFPLSDDWSLAWGLSSEFGPNPSGPDNRSAIYGSDVYLKYRPITQQSFVVVSLTSEWFYRRRQVPQDIVQDVSSYSELFFRFAQRWATAARYEYGSPPLDQNLDPFPSDPLDPDWTAKRQRVALQLTHYPSEFSRFRLQVSRDMPGFADAVWAAFLSAELAIGAHGAHTF